MKYSSSLLSVLQRPHVFKQKLTINGPQGTLLERDLGLADGTGHPSNLLSEITGPGPDRPEGDATHDAREEAGSSVVLDQICSFLEAISTTAVNAPPPLLLNPAQPPAPPTPPPPPAAAVATVLVADHGPPRSSGRLAAKPSSSLSAMDKARLVLMRKDGIISGDGQPTPDALQKYKDLYKEELPQHFIDAVTALVEATDATKKKKKQAPRMAAEGRAVAV